MDNNNGYNPNGNYDPNAAINNTPPAPSYDPNTAPQAPGYNPNAGYTAPQAPAYDPNAGYTTPQAPVYDPNAAAGYNAYQTPGYNPNQYNNPYAYGEDQNSKTKAIISLVLGVLAIIFTLWVSMWVGFAMSISGIILAAGSMKKLTTSKGFAIGGLVTSIISLVIFVVTFVIICSAAMLYL